MNGTGNTAQWGQRLPVTHMQDLRHEIAVHVTARMPHGCCLQAHARGRDEKVAVASDLPPVHAIFEVNDMTSAQNHQGRSIQQNAAQWPPGVLVGDLRTS